MTAPSFAQIAADFEFLDDWEDRYRYVIDLGKAMPALDDTLRGPETKVDGCASQVWLVPRIEGAGDAARLHFDGDSDALIVRGLIAVLRALYNGSSAAAALEIDAAAAFRGLGLDQHLSAQRSNGLRAMIARIRTIAEHMRTAA
ncbi:MAG: SufE family protein [Pseudomonadota bacterium]